MIFSAIRAKILTVCGVIENSAHCLECSRARVAMVSTTGQDKMATQSLVKDVVNEEKLIDLWPDYPCMYDVRSPEFKNRDKREKAVTEMAQKLEQTGM